MIDPSMTNEICEQLSKDIIDYRKEINVTSVSKDPVSLMAAKELCSIGTTGYEVSTLLDLQTQGDKANSADQNIEKYFTYAVILMVIAIIPLIYYMVINKGA